MPAGFAAQESGLAPANTRISMEVKNITHFIMFMPFFQILYRLISGGAATNPLEYK